MIKKNSIKILVIFLFTVLFFSACKGPQPVSSTPIDSGLFFNLAPGQSEFNECFPPTQLKFGLMTQIQEILLGLVNIASLI